MTLGRRTTAPKRAARAGAAKAASAPPQIDRGKLRDALRTIGDEYVFYMLDEAIDLLPPGKLLKLVGKYIQIERLRPDAQTRGTKRSLLEDVRVFDAASRAGKYYVSFNVNSKNHMEISTGTRAFIAECLRLLDRCVVEAAKDSPADTHAAFDTIFALLRHIDEGHDDVVFFADEGGSWQVGVDWKRVFPGWFRCLSRSVNAEDFASAVVATVDAFEEHARATHLTAARKLATTEQRRALDARLAATSPRRR